MTTRAADLLALLDTMQARLDGREDRWYMDLVDDNIRLIAAVRAVLDRARIEQDDAEVTMAYAAEINDGPMLVSQQARKQAWADAARAIATALEEVGS